MDTELPRMGEAVKVGAAGTPSFVLARTDPGNPQRVTGLEFIRDGALEGGSE